MKTIYNPVFIDAAHRKHSRNAEFASNGGKACVRKYLHEYKKAENFLRSNPHMYPRYESEFNPNLQYLLFHDGRYRIVYETVEDMVYIYDIQDCRQDGNKSLI